MSGDGFLGGRQCVNAQGARQHMTDLAILGNDSHNESFRSFEKGIMGCRGGKYILMPENRLLNPAMVVSHIDDLTTQLESNLMVGIDGILEGAVDLGQVHDSGLELGQRMECDVTFTN
uniref:Uncharacterized protein n=1 Tax=Pristionchus pacificus TaxID=54126 RepID=A0A2A6BU06_PRIPA|eukprot:PDM69337.1 hypothetical protein PRIPAC_47639 [Pristionchus pacificus]